MNANNSENGRKRYLVPLVALLLCAVAMAGVAYAYTTQHIDNHETPTEFGDLSITCDGGKIYFSGDVNKIANTATFTSSASESVLKFTVTDANEVIASLKSVTVGIFTDSACTAVASGLTASVAQGDIQGMSFLVKISGTVSGAASVKPLDTYYLKLTVNGVDISVTVPTLA